MLQTLLADTLFQQNRALTHYARKVRAILYEDLPDLWIGRRGPTNRQAGFFDPTPLEFFLREFVKDRVQRTPVSNFTRLKRRITTAIHEIQANILQNV